MKNQELPSQLLAIDEDMFADDPEMKYILDRLQQATNDPEIRKLMDAEDRLLAQEMNMA